MSSKAARSKRHLAGRLVLGAVALNETYAVSWPVPDRRRHFGNRSLVCGSRFGARFPAHNAHALVMASMAIIHQFNITHFMYGRHRQQKPAKIYQRFNITTIINL